MSQEVSASKKLYSLIPLYLAAIFMLCGMMFLVWLGREKNVIVNTPMSDLDLAPLIDVEEAPTLASLQGKVTILHFWGTWCGPCRDEYPEFSKLMAKLRIDPNVQVLSVSCSGGPETDLPGLEEETRKFLEEIPNKLPIYADPAAFTRGKIAGMFASGGFAYPTTVVVDTKGTIRSYYRGKANMQKLEKDVVNALTTK